jgi:putative PEP-CTERM system TPR-repeat lipoprotein
MHAIKLNLWTMRLALPLLCLGLLLSGCGLTGRNGSLDAGAKYQAAGKYRAAYIEAKKVLQNDKKNGKAWLLLGKASLMLGDPKSALDDLQHAQANGVPEEAWVVPMGQGLQVTRQYDKLLKTLSPDKLTDPKIKRHTYVLRGDAQLELKQLDKARQSYQDALKLDPKDPRALVGLAKVSATAGDMDSAKNYVQEALAAEPENPQALVVKGDLAFNNKDFASAESDYQKVIGLKHPDWLPQERLYALTRLANVQAQQKQYVQALSTIKTIEKMSPGQPYPHYLHAVVLYMQGHLSQAMSELQQVLKIQPDNASAQFLMGVVNYAQGNYAQAEMYLSNVMGMDQKNVRARRFLALTLYRSGSSQQALNTLRPSVPGHPSDTELKAMLQKAVADGVGKPGAKNSVTGEKNPPDSMIAQTDKALASGNTPEAIRLLKAMPAGDVTAETRRNIMLVMAYLRDKHVDKAVKTAADFVAKNPKESAAHMLYANALVVAGKRTDARAQYSRAYKLDPKNLAALLNLGNLDLLEKHYKDAADRYTTVLEKDPKNALAMTALGRLAMQQGDKSKAIQRFKQAIDAAPKSATAYLSLMVIYSHDGQYDEAVNISKKMVASNPENPMAFNALGAAELNAGHHSQALKPLQQAVNLAPKDPLYRTNLARAQIINKDSKDARDNLTQVIKAHPAQVQAVTLLAFMKLQEHDLPGAITLAQTLQKYPQTKAEGFSLEGDLYMANKSWQQAAQAYQQGLKIDYVRPLVIRYFQALSQSAAKAPEGVLRNWLAKHPDDDAMRLILGQYYVGHGQNTQAAVQYKKVLKAYPTNVSALNNLAWIYTEQHNREGLSLAERAYKLAPQSPNIADTYGWALITSHQPGKALPILLKAVKADPKEPTMQYHLALAQARTGDKAGARSTLEALQKSGAAFQDKQAAEKLYRELTDAGTGSGKK